jgi:uncharacterized protein YdaU (DUF1376 family)
MTLNEIERADAEARELAKAQKHIEERRRELGITPGSGGTCAIPGISTPKEILEPSLSLEKQHAAASAAGSNASKPHREKRKHTEKRPQQKRYLFWYRNYLSDFNEPKFRLASAEAQGVVRRMFDVYWEQLCQGLPDDDAQLARLACLAEGEITRSRSLIREYFSRDRRGLLRAHLLDNQHKLAEEISAHNAEAAKGRWGQRKAEKEDA